MGDKQPDVDVFISYAKSRRKLTASLAKQLEAAGFTTWWDTDVLAGDDFRQEIENQLDACKAAIIIWTPESIDSMWVRSEAGHALRLSKLINTHVAEVKLERLPKPFDQLHSVRLTDRAAILDAVRKRVEAANTDEPAPATLMDRPPLPASRRWWIGAGLAVLIAAGVAALLLKGQFASAPAPQWTFDNQPVFLGQTIPFTWQYTAPASAESVCFEIVSARDEAFQFESRTETCTDAEHYFAGDINGARYWRVRAVDIRTGEPLSPWSPAIKVAQFESVYERIKATGELDIYASRSQDQDIFKFVKNKGVQGVDFKLSRLILDELSSRLDRAIEADWKSVAWQDLLPKAGEGLADFVISSITETPEREREFHITFSDSYFCTTHALIFRAGTADGAIAAMIAGKKVGVQSATTNARLAAALAEGGAFEVIAFPNTESLENALLGAQIDFGITDTSFARAAQLDTRLGNGMNRLDLKEFAPGDLPASLQDQQTQQYAIAVRTGEFELLDTINDVIAKAKQDGSLARAFKESAEEYEEAFGLPPGSRRQDARPWDCANQTATAQ